MKVEKHHDMNTRSDVIVVSIDDREKIDALSAREIINEIRHQVAKAISDVIIEKVRPVVEEALKV